MKRIVLLRRMTSLLSADSANSAEATERVLDRLRHTRDNQEFLAKLTKET
jgi:transcription termination factor Rho